MDLLNDSAPSLVLLADDLSGALEVGSMLATLGIETIVSLDCDPARLGHGQGALVIDTETRHVSGTEARRVVHDLARAARPQRPRCIFKKTDSTLRGNIAGELAGLLEACAPMPLVYAPAHPPMRRAVRRGRLYVDGIELASTSFAVDGLDPVSTSDVTAVVRSGFDGPVVSTSPSGLAGPLRPGTIYVCDGERTEDLDAAARFFIGSRATILAAGPAPFAAAIVGCLGGRRQAVPPLPSIQRALVVNGSRHEASRSQVAHAERAGMASIDPESPDSGARGWRVLSVPEVSGVDAATHSRRLGAAARRAVEAAEFDALVVFGGDTAHGVAEAFGRPEIESLGEVLPGVALSCLRRGATRPLYLLTKPGGFGCVDVITELRRTLQAGRPGGGVDGAA